jgi:Iap family predicted aminopeptidase
MKVYLTYPMIVPLVEKVNRAHKRDIEREREKILEKLTKICSHFEQECERLPEDYYSFEYDFLFETYNMIFTRAVDQFAGKIKHFAIHRGFFFMWYKRERIGVVRNEEVGRQNTLERILSTPIEENLASMLRMDSPAPRAHND